MISLFWPLFVFGVLGRWMCLACCVLFGGREPRYEGHGLSVIILLSDLFCVFMLYYYYLFGGVGEELENVLVRMAFKRRRVPSDGYMMAKSEQGVGFYAVDEVLCRPSPDIVSRS